MSRNGRIDALLLLAQALTAYHVADGTPVIHSFSPKSSPATGGTQISVHGQGFIKSGVLRSKCHFRTSKSARFSTDTTVINETFLLCSTPPVPFFDASVASVGTVDFSVTAVNKFSSRHDFVFFDFRRISVKSMSPVEGGVSRKGVVTMSGEGFYPSGEMACLASGVRLSSAVFLNSSALRCDIPPVYVSMRVSIKVSLNGGDSSGIIPANDSVTTLTFYYDAPRLLSAVFSGSLSEISLEFNTKVEIGGEDETNSGRNPDCKTILDDQSYRLVGGDNASCHWATQQQRRVVVSLPSTARVLIGSTLTLRGENVRVRWQLFSRLARGNTIVIVPFDVQRPVAIIEGPSLIPICGNVTIMGRNSQAVGYAPLNFKWWISSYDTNDVPDLSIYDVSTLDVPSNWFRSNVTYAVHLIVSSHLGFISKAANYTLTKATSSVPVIEILGPLERTIYCSDDLFLESDVSLPLCNHQTSIRGYQWILTLNNQSVPLDSIISNTLVLSIPSGTLACNHVYHAWLSVRSSNRLHQSDRITDSSLVVIETREKELDARIVGGTAWSISQLQVFHLDGSLSLDPNGDDDANYEWDCVIYNTTSPCVNASSGYVLMFPDDSFAYDEPVDLNPQQSYTITLNYTKTGRLFSVSQAVITITDDPEEVPVVGIVPPANIQSINPSEQVTLQAYVDSYFNTTIKWSSPSDLPGYGRLNMTDPNVISTPNQYQLVSSISKLSTESGDLRKYLLVTSEDDDDLRSVYLSIRPDSLRPGIPYRFRVTATNEFGSNFAEVTIKTAPVPSGCHVIVEPPIGQALDTFVIQAVGCVVEPTRYPLIYRYGTKRTNDEEIEWLGGVTYRSSLASLLPVGNRDDGFELLVFARVEDNQGVHQTFSSTAIINDSNSTNLTLHEARIATKAATHWRSALRSLQAVLSTINADPTRFVPEQVDSFKSVSVGVLNDLSTHSIPRQKGDLMQLLVILQELTEKTDANNVVDANTKTVISLVESAVSDVVNSDVENHFDAGFSAHEGAQVLTIYSNLLPDEHDDVVQNQVTESLRRVVDKVGFGMCKQQTYGSVKESAVFGLGALETSISTPLGQHRVGCSLETTTNCNINDDDNLLVDYGSSLSRGYLTWSCHNNETCNGVCTVSAHITANLFQTPSIHDPVHKSDTISLSLLDPKSGEELEIGNLDEPVVFTLKLTVPSERNGEVQCVYRDEELDRMSTDGCVTRLVSQQSYTPTHVLACLSGDFPAWFSFIFTFVYHPILPSTCSSILSSRSVCLCLIIHNYMTVLSLFQDDGVSDTDVLPIGSPVYCECNHLSVFLVVEQCPPGFYGNQCEHSKPLQLTLCDIINWFYCRRMPAGFVGN